MLDVFVKWHNLSLTIGKPHRGARDKQAVCKDKHAFFGDKHAYDATMTPFEGQPLGQNHQIARQRIKMQDNASQLEHKFAHVLCFGKIFC